MGILLNPDKEFVQFQLQYVEERTKQGSSKFFFVKNQEEFTSWKSRGYLTSDEMERAKEEAAKPQQPGMPAKSPPDETKVIDILRTFWSQMTWKEQNSLYSRCLKQSTGSDGSTKTELDAILFRDRKLKTCLKRWDLKDNGKDVPVTEGIIDQLHPEVAQELLNQFESITEADEEELKN